MEAPAHSERCSLRTRLPCSISQPVLVTVSNCSGFAAREGRFKLSRQMRGRSDPSPRVAGRQGRDTAIGALLTCEDCVCEDTISAGGGHLSGGRVREIRRVRRRVRIGAPDALLTRFSGTIAVTELVDRLAMIKLLDAAIGPIKSGIAGSAAGSCWSGSPRRSWPGRTSWSGWPSTWRPGRAGVGRGAWAGLDPAAGLARKFTDAQWHAVETGLADVATAALGRWAWWRRRGRRRCARR